MNKDEELSKYLAQIEQYKEQLSSLEMQLQYLQAAISDYDKGKITLKNLEETDDKTEILVPIGGSTYISATANDTKKVLFDIGSGTVTEKKIGDAIKKIGDAIKKIDERIEDLHKTQENLKSLMEKLQSEAMEISTKAQTLYAEQQG